MKQTVGAPLVSVCRGRVGRLVPLLAVGAATSMASAGTTASEMEAIEFPITIASIVTAVTVGGAAMLIAWAGPKLGFKFTRALIGRLGNTV